MQSSSLVSFPNFSWPTHVAITVERVQIPAASFSHTSATSTSFCSATSRSIDFSSGSSGTPPSLIPAYYNGTVVGQQTLGPGLVVDLSFRKPFLIPFLLLVGKGLDARNLKSSGNDLSSAKW